MALILVGNSEVSQRRQISKDRNEGEGTVEARDRGGMTWGVRGQVRPLLSSPSRPLSHSQPQGLNQEAVLTYLQGPGC